MYLSKVGDCEWQVRVWSQLFLGSSPLSIAKV